MDDKLLYSVVDALEEIAAETGRAIAQVALKWLLARPDVANVVIGARDEHQLRQNLATLEFQLTPEQVARLDAVSRRTPIYPYWHQRDFNGSNPKPTQW